MMVLNGMLPERYVHIPRDECYNDYSNSSYQNTPAKRLIKKVSLDVNTFKRNAPKALILKFLMPG
jgi:hypothetical protein